MSRGTVYVEDVTLVMEKDKSFEVLIDGKFEEA